MRVQECGVGERQYQRRSCAYVRKDSAEAECIRIYGIPEWKKRPHGVWSFPANETRERQALVGTRVLRKYGWDKWEAYQALTQIGKLYVGNMVDTYYSLVAKIDKKYALIQD